MTRIITILAIILLTFLSVTDINSQPGWVNGTPSVASTGPLSITTNYGIDRKGTVYIIVFNYNNPTIYTSTYVRNNAIIGTGSAIVARAVLTVENKDIKKVLQVVLNVIDVGQVHSIYIVAADSKGVLQASPVRLTATTLPCTPPNAGNGGKECDLNFKLNAVLSFGTGRWTLITGPGNATFAPNPNTPDATVTVSSYGIYTFRWTETKGECTTSSEIVVGCYRQPLANAGIGGNACDLNFSLNAKPSIGTGTWTMTNGSGTASFSPSANSPTAIVTVSAYGTKVFTWTEVNGSCANSSTVTVNFYEPPRANAGTGGNNCGLEFNLNAIPSLGRGTWTRVSGTGSAVFSPNPNIPNAEVRVSDYGTYVFRWTEVNGPCSNAATVSVTFVEQLFANAGNGGDECDRDFLLNAVQGTVQGTWTKVNGPGTAIFSPNPNQANAKVTVSNYGAYDFAWTEISNICSSTDIIRVAFHAPPSIIVGEEAGISKGDSIQLHAVGTGTFFWKPENLFKNPTYQNPFAFPTSTTIFTVTLTDQYGCKNSDQVTIEVREIPKANAGPNQELNYQFETNLEAVLNHSYETGEWTILSGSGAFADRNYSSTLVELLSLNENSFIWTVTNGFCPVSSDTVKIIVHDLVIPTLITPNMDGKNDFFIVGGLQTFGKTELIIFNRWGAQVYKNNNYDNSWDGKDDNSRPLSDDTYFFILKPEKNKTINGYIVIKRQNEKDF